MAKGAGAAASLLSIDDACNLRLVNKAWSVVAGAHILPEVTFRFHEKDLARLRLIAAHPVLAPNVKSLGYIAETYESTPISYAEFVHDIKSNHMVKKLDPDMFAHLPPIITSEDFPAHYELYKQTVAAQAVLNESKADAFYYHVGWEPVLPRIFKKNPAYDDGCIRKPHFEGDPEGVATLDVLLNAVANHEMSLLELRAGMFDWRFFEKDPGELSRLFNPFKDATYIDLSLSIDSNDNFEDITGDMEKCRACLQSGSVADILQSMPRLTDLSFSIFTINPSKRAVSLGHVIAPGYHWPNLTTLDLDNVDCERHELWNFLLLHKDSLKSLCLKDILLTKGSWKVLLPDIRKSLLIEYPCICGSIRGFAEKADESSGALEEYELGFPGVGPNDMRSSINLYCTRGGELYPDELPLTPEIVGKYFESHVREEGMKTEEEDAALMEEEMRKSDRRRALLDRIDPGWDRMSESDDDDSEEEFGHRPEGNGDVARFGEQHQWGDESDSEAEGDWWTKDRTENGANYRTKRFNHAGLYVIATARRPEVLDGLAEMGMSALQLDVTDQDSIKACEEQVAAITGGKLDILVNNAQVFPCFPNGSLRSRVNQNEESHSSCGRAQ
ncbi:short chain dehydrogenase [Apiospora rasikravindrae]|uniref:Short chain dehydrogenase n=1 Tax=Apiospora rasikravindrae TaxID=990691 RepID=A0ABR1SPJ4_9PEZI